MLEHATLYRGYRFPREVIAHAVRLFLRSALSYRDVEELLAERGVRVSYATVRRRAAKFGTLYADELRRAVSSPTCWTVEGRLRGFFEEGACARRSSARPRSSAPSCARRSRGAGR